MHVKEDTIVNTIKAYHQLEENFQKFVSVWDRHLKENEWLEMAMEEEDKKSFVLRTLDGESVKASFSFSLVEVAEGDQPYGLIVFTRDGGNDEGVCEFSFNLLGSLWLGRKMRSQNSIHNLNHFYKFSEVVYTFIDRYLDYWRKAGVA